MLNVSVIIPTYNRLEQLKKCLKSLLLNNWGGFEIIIVNDASTDGTFEYLNNLKNPKIKVIHHAKNKGVSEARNSGITIAQGEILAFTDDDCETQDRWLENLVKKINDNKVDFVFGPTYYVKPEYKGFFPERIIYSLNWPGGGNIAYHKKVFEKSGNFNTIFEKYRNEDTEMAIRAVANGFSYEFEPNAICYHQPDYWNATSLLKSAKTGAAWPVLKKTYPKHFLSFNSKSKMPIRFGIFICPKDYLYFILLPILIPILLIRYLYHGKRDLKIFFTKWPLLLFLRRYHIYREAIKNGVFML